MATFMFTLEELQAIEKENPDNENIEDLKIGEDHAHCCGCNWEVTRLYVLAETQTEAKQLLLSGDAGLCGECYASMLTERKSTMKTFDRYLRVLWRCISMGRGKVKKQ
jgi:hypothetical protein